MRPPAGAPVGVGNALDSRRAAGERAGKLDGRRGTKWLDSRRTRGRGRARWLAARLDRHAGARRRGTPGWTVAEGSALLGDGSWPPIESPGGP